MADSRPRRSPAAQFGLPSLEPNQAGVTFAPPQHAVLHPSDEEASFTFVCLGVGGGPLEGDCSCYMLKPAHREWSSGAVVVEGGSWLGALTRVLENVSADSAFSEVQFPHDSPALRAGYLGSFAHSFLISHAHLDHILGMVLGSASLPGRRNVFVLRPTLENLLDVFNGKIWPKLASFEDNGGPAVYLLKAMENQIDMKVDDDLSVLPFALSHGLNPSVPPAPPTPTQPYSMPQSYFSKRYSLPLNGYFPNVNAVSPLDRAAHSSADKPLFTSPFAPERSKLSGMMDSARIDEDRVADAASYQQSNNPKDSARNNFPPRSSRRPKTALGSEHSVEESDASSVRTLQAAAGTKKAPPKRVSIDISPPALDSTAFFITNNRTGKDVLFFGDVEPDCVSQSPRNKKVWAHAARRYAEGKLNTIFLECSFPASHPTEFLYGHLSVKYLYDELRNLSKFVLAEKKRQRLRRQRVVLPGMASPVSTPSPTQEISNPYARLNTNHLPSIPSTPSLAAGLNDEDLFGSLKGLSIVIIHVKMALFPSYEATAAADDAPASPSSASSFSTAENGEDVTIGGVGDETEMPHKFSERIIDHRTMQERILEELNEVESESKLGVHFVMAKQGMRIAC